MLEGSFFRHMSRRGCLGRTLISPQAVGRANGFFVRYQVSDTWLKGPLIAECQDPAILMRTQECCAQKDINPLVL